MLLKKVIRAARPSNINILKNLPDFTNLNSQLTLQPNTRPTRKLMNRSGANNSHLSCLFSYLLQHSTFLMRLKPS